ncbi:carbohydrate ABC transporter substrate-binding protein (CUT1 family) [Eilatimonas milleporae]|uniref:Carbohydrate ABC transporter substrate-binding protein (CUT1 family) n=2 Tax=Eilatimonas milleporae TaxID=911205 RepID=A0A3M0CX26_9PROT|nr:carbohydrate ABC transporter substrate-binding protein (CUT1 family) [Eilatimonas milleporae]
MALTQPRCLHRGLGEIMPTSQFALGHMVRLFGVLAVVTMAVSSAHAGSLVIRNSSDAAITCSVDGYTMATGWPFDWTITVEAGKSFVVGPSYEQEKPVIDWADCGGLKTSHMAITPDGPDGYFYFTGTQSRVLNAALYPYLPNLPGGTFNAMVQHVIETYQTENPDVLLNAVLNGNLDIYSYEGLTRLLGADGFDIMELDMLYLQFLADSDLILPTEMPLDNYQDIGLAAVTAGGNQAYGVPSWLCMDFTFSFAEGVKAVTSLEGLSVFLSDTPEDQTPLVGNFNGSWRLPAMYISGYMGQFPDAPIANALQMPPNDTVITNLTTLTEKCNFDDGNKCIDDTYHDAANGTTEQVLATGRAKTDVGFSEQSFYIKLYGGPEPLWAIGTPWGNTINPLLYTDAFVRSAANCADDPCKTDGQAFIALMTSDPMKTFITQSQDLDDHAPYRRLLTATKSFYELPWVKEDALYTQFHTVFETGASFPNNITDEQQTSIGTQVCAALKAQNPAYVCKSEP